MITMSGSCDWWKLTTIQDFQVLGAQNVFSKATPQSLPLRTDFVIKVSKILTDKN